MKPGSILQSAPIDWSGMKEPPIYTKLTEEFTSWLSRSDVVLYANKTTLLWKNQQAF